MASSGLRRGGERSEAPFEKDEGDEEAGKQRRSQNCETLNKNLSNVWACPFEQTILGPTIQACAPPFFGFNPFLFCILGHTSP